MAKTKLLKIPDLKTDEEAEAFMMQDLTPYLHAGNFKRVKLDFGEKHMAKAKDKPAKEKKKPSAKKPVKKPAKGKC